MSPWTSHLTSLGPIFLQNGHQSEAHPWVVQNSHYSMEKPSWSAQQPWQMGTIHTILFKQLMGYRKMAVCRMIHPGPPTVLAHPSAHILGE